MKTKILSFIFLLLLAIACKHEDVQLYNSPANVYFDFSDGQRDSLLYSFALEPSRLSDTIQLPVKLSGIQLPQDRQFIIKVDANLDSTTAKANLHYKPLDSVYTLPANTGSIKVPLVIYNKDTALQSKSVQIRFKLYPTADLDTSLNTLIKGRVVFSSKLEQPSWWNMWMGGYFSQVKFQLFIIVTGQTSMTTNSLDAPRNLYYVSQLTTFLANPTTWIAKNSAKGYVLDKQDDQTYYFYSKDNPQKKILYKYDAQGNRFFFIDENGLHVN